MITLLSQIAPPLASRTLALVLKLAASMIPATRRPAAAAFTAEIRPISVAVMTRSQRGIAVDAAGIADDEHGEQDEDDQDERPAGIAVPELRRQGGP